MSSDLKMSQDWSNELPPLPASPARILVFVAMRAEAEPVARALGAPVERASDASSGRPVRVLVPGNDLSTGVDRIGPVHAAWALTRALAADRPDLVVNLGTAGGFRARGVGIADLVLARESRFHDARVALDGFDRMARAHLRLSPSEEELERVARRLGGHVGLVTTGSSLDATPEELSQFDRIRALAKEMELAALGAVCAIERVPLVAVKSVTDLVDDREPTHEAFARNLDRACQRLADAAPALLAALQA